QNLNLGRTVRRAKSGWGRISRTEHLESPKLFYLFNGAPTAVISTLSLHDALPISHGGQHARVVGRLEEMPGRGEDRQPGGRTERSEEHTSELQSRGHLVCRLLLEKKKTRQHKSRQHRAWQDNLPTHPRGDVRGRAL